MAAAFELFIKMMEEERNKEDVKVEKQYLVTSHPPSLPREPYIWLMSTNRDQGSERHMFYSITEGRYYVRFVEELQNKHVACCYGGWLVLRDKSNDYCSILNILTLEKFQLPPLDIPPHHEHTQYICRLCTDCVVSSPIMDKSCRIIFIEQSLCKFWSCHLGDSEFIERELTYKDGIFSDLINFKGKLYAVTARKYNLIAFDLSDPDLRHEQVISGKSIPDFISLTLWKLKFYLVESCGDLLLISMAINSNEVRDLQILKADFSVGEWVILETLGDRSIFLGPRNNTFSCPAAATEMKGNSVYWVNTLISWAPPEKYLFIYDIEDKSISMSLPFPIVGTYSSLSWVSFPITCNEEKKQDQKYKHSLFEDYSHVRRENATIESTELPVLQHKVPKTEETKTIGSSMVTKESLWADLPNDLLLEIFQQLFAGERVTFRSVCRSWSSLSPSRTTQQFVLPLQCSDCSSPLLMCPNNKTYHPIHDELYSMDFLDIRGANVRATRNGWLLMDYLSLENRSTKLFFYNPFTKARILLPDCNAAFYQSVFFSAPPTSADCLVVVAARRWDKTYAIFFKMREDEDWTCREISSFFFSNCNAVVYDGVYYFLGTLLDRDKLLIFSPKKDEIRVIEDSKLKSDLCVERYLLECDGKIIAVLVSRDGSSVYTYRWNVCTSKWETLESLGNIMLFVSRPLSLCIRATVSGTGNKIYFPRVAGDGHILFYSLATKRYHTFEMGTSYSNFFASKFYPHYNGWFMP